MDKLDSNIHISNKVLIKNILSKYENRENIITTHFLTLTHHFNNNNIVMINNGQIEDKTKQEIFPHITYSI